MSKQSKLLQMVPELSTFSDSRGSHLVRTQQFCGVLEERSLSFRTYKYELDGKLRRTFSPVLPQIYDLKMAKLNLLQLLQAVGATIASEYMSESVFFPFCEIRFGIQHIITIRPHDNHNVSISVLQSAKFVEALVCDANDADKMFACFFLKSAERCTKGKKTTQSIQLQFPHWILQAYDFSLGLYESQNNRFYVATDSKGGITVKCGFTTRHFDSFEFVLPFLQALD